MMSSLLNGAAEIVPDALGRQLKPDGRLVGVCGHAPGSQRHDLSR